MVSHGLSAHGDGGSRPGSGRARAWKCANPLCQLEANSHCIEAANGFGAYCCENCMLYNGGEEEPEEDAAGGGGPPADERGGAAGPTTSTRRGAAHDNQPYDIDAEVLGNPPGTTHHPPPP